MSELGSLSQCIVDADPEGLARARGLRRRALVVSVALQAVCLAALLVLPLVATNTLLPSYVLTPLPPYHGGGGSAERPHLRHMPTRTFRPRPSALAYHPLETVRRAHEFSGEPAPVIGAETGNSEAGPGGPIGMMIPGAGDSGLPVEPPRPAAPREPIMKSEGVMAGALIHRVDPIYPVVARAIHLSGTVRLHAIIATDGTVQSLEVLSGNPVLLRAAVAAVRQWRYRPTLLNGSPVEVETYVTVNFVLGG